MYPKYYFVLSVLPLILLASLPCAAADEPQLAVIDEAGNVQQVIATDISRQTRRKIETSVYDKTNAEYEGVSLVDFL